MSLEKTYSELKKKFKNLDFEDYSVVKSVDEHRNYWKPKKVETLLLAESHVFTSKSDHETTMDYSKFAMLENCPASYVRLVYCLGYGESALAKVNKNPGTPQFWKIFASCANKEFQFEQEKILKTRTPNLIQRLKNKIALLEKLKEKGIWLLDASVIALYKDSIKPPEDIMQNIAQICWKYYILETIRDSQPNKIIVIGKGVLRFLSSELNSTGIPIVVQPQPNARLSSNEIKKMFERYYKLCNSDVSGSENPRQNSSSIPKSYFHPSQRKSMNFWEFWKKLQKELKNKREFKTLKQKKKFHAQIEHTKHGETVVRIITNVGLPRGPIPVNEMEGVWDNAKRHSRETRFVNENKRLEPYPKKNGGRGKSIQVAYITSLIDFIVKDQDME